MQPDTESDLERMFAFAIELEKLKSVTRRTKVVGADRYENSAEHSWQVCVMAMLLAGRAEQELDLQRVLELLLVHDIPEIDCGDQIVYHRDEVERSKAERAAADRLFGMLSSKEGAVLRDRWQEFEEGKSAESRFARAIDRLMPLLLNLRNGGQSWKENAIAMEDVISKCSSIGTALPHVWSSIEYRVEAHFRGAGPSESTS